MPITELVLLRLTTPTTPLSPTTKATLHKAQKAQTAYSGHQVHFLRQIEDPCLFYVLGGWESVARHNEDWIPGETNQGLLEQLEGDVGVVWMFHIDVEPSEVTVPLDASGIVITRYFVESGRKEEFQRVFDSGAPHLGRDAASCSYCGGWRIDKEGDDEEFVVFSGWDRGKESGAFERSGKFEEVKDVAKGVEIRHVRIEEWD